MVNIVPVLLGVFLSTLVLLAAQRFPERTAVRTCRSASSVFTLYCIRGIRQLVRSSGIVIETLQSAVRNHFNRFRQAMAYRKVVMHRSSDTNGYWILAGSLWLGIAGLLLAGFVFTQ